MKIAQSTAFVTGANRGIGRALVAELLEDGASRIYATARKFKDLEPVVALDPTRIVPVELDITDRHAVKAAVKQAEDVNLLINNAGVAAFGSVLGGPLEMVLRDMDTNYYGTLNVIRAFVPVLEGNAPAAVVNLLTVVALAAMPGLGGYSASKAALFSMTQAVRAELSDKGIGVHGVFPGPIDTDMTREVDMPKTSPDDVARAVLTGVENGQEDIFPDPMSRDAHAAWLQDPKALERQFGAMM